MVILVMMMSAKRVGPTDIDFRLVLEVNEACCTAYFRRACFVLYGFRLKNSSKFECLKSFYSLYTKIL